MSNINKQARDKLKSAAAKAVDNFDPNMFVETRDVLALLDELEAAEYTAAVRLEALDNRISELNTMRYRIKTLNGTVDIVDGQRDRWMERCKDAEAKLEAAEKRIAELEAREVTLPPVELVGYGDWPMFDANLVTEVLRTAGINIAAAGKGEAS